MIKVGILGCGFMGATHLACFEVLKDMGVKVTAVADIRPEFAQKLAEQCGAEVYGSGMELIERADVNVVDVCLPTDEHVSHSIAAMRKGYDIFLEKPICLHEEEMDEILRVEAETGVKVMVGQVIRLWSEYVWLKEAKESGAYGRFLCGEFHRLSAKPDWAGQGWLHDPGRSGGVAVDMHVHDVDFVRYLLGEPDRVQVQACRDESGLIEHIYAQYGYGTDVAVAIEAGWNYPSTYPFTAGFRVNFEKAAVVLDGSGLTVYPYEGDPFQPDLREEFQADNNLGGNVTTLGGYYNELKYFIDGLHGEHAMDVATLAEAIQSVKLAKREIELAGGLIVK